MAEHVRAVMDRHPLGQVASPEVSRVLAALVLESVSLEDDQPDRP